jgi:hypothetical protein
MTDTAKRNLASEALKSTCAEIVAAKERFDAAHADGMAALKARDYDALEDAIQRESEAAEALSRVWIDTEGK